MKRFHGSASQGNFLSLDMLSFLKKKGLIKIVIVKVWQTITVDFSVIEHILFNLVKYSVLIPFMIFFPDTIY